MQQSPRDAGVAIYFSDFFNVEPRLVEEHGAFNVSLIADMPLFVDPFLLFNSSKPEYEDLHQGIISYLQFLLGKAMKGGVGKDSLAAWFRFKEVKETWLGFSKTGNAGSGPGPGFAHDLANNLNSVFRDFGNERVTRGSHLEKLCLIAPGVGRDNISDFTVCLIKEFLLKYTQEFTIQHISEELTWCVSVPRVQFNYKTESWESGVFRLPKWNNQHVILTPMDILARDDTWINRKDFMNSFEVLAVSLPDDALRGQLDNYFRSRLVIPIEATDAEKEKLRTQAIQETVKQFPQIIEHYIRRKEDEGDKAVSTSEIQVESVFDWFVTQVGVYVANVLGQSEFYELPFDSYDAAMARLLFLKSFVEDKDGYRIFYHDGLPVQRESDLQLLYKLTWYASRFDMNAEVNNGRGPVDFKVSWGSKDKALVEFKLAKNKKLKSGLKNQLEVYGKANETERAIWAIFFFSEGEYRRVIAILEELDMLNDLKIILIDCRGDNKPSGSNA